VPADTTLSLMPGGLPRLTSLPFSLSRFDVPQGTPSQSSPRRASLCIETPPGIPGLNNFFTGSHL